MAREREMQDFIRSLFRGRPDLSVLTHSIVRQKYLAHVGLDHLEPEDKKKLKRLVEEELLKMQVEGEEEEEEKEEEEEEEEEEELLSGDQDRGKRPLSPNSSSRTSQVKKRKKPCINSETEHSSDDSGLDPQPMRPLSCPRSLAGNGITRQDCCSVEEGMMEAEKVLRPARKMTAKENEDSEEEEEEEEEFRAFVRKKGVKEVLEEESESRSEEETCHKQKGRVGKKEATKLGKEEPKVNPSVKAVRKVAQVSESDQTDSEGGNRLIPQKKGPKNSEEMKDYSSRKRVVGKLMKEESSEDEEKKDLLRKRETKQITEETIRLKGSSGKKGMRKLAKDNSMSSDEEKEESNSYCRDQKSRGRNRGGRRTKTTRNWGPPRGGKRSEKQSESSGEEESDNKGKEDSGKTGEEESENSSEAEKEMEKVPSEDSEEESRTDDSNKSSSRKKGTKNTEDESEASEEEEEKTGRIKKKAKNTEDESEASEEERTGRTKKKEAKRGRVRPSSTSSQDSSPEPKSGKGSRKGEDHPAVVRLKRYIRACGAHRNYKRLLGSCRSHQERLRVLKAELQDLGLEGNPSLEKCRAVKERREEAAEMASLDVSNIISSSGRSRRRNAWNPRGEVGLPQEELYHRRALDSDGDEPRAHPPPTDWSNLRGIISSDGESD
ncbi:HIRA-interacting protein 3 isoform X1 [Monodelphis domestica]|uniref:HIRA interacting protein 3 n=1 Tax=Monodelphis domestica TaxID=13616 RepID=F6PIN7_MONDO|nr:HIRA-interacting protein 3 isoform X1 [Monodelphis domestica]